MTLEQILQTARETPGCRVFPPSGMPEVSPELRLRGDVAAFYEMCGGMNLFLDENFGFKIVAPDEFQLANITVLGREYYEAHRELMSGDIICNWYIVGQAANFDGVAPGEDISIDLSVERNGFCYDSFHEVHGTAHSRIIARSFSELLERLLSVRGKVLFWETPGFPDYGRAR